VDYPIVLWGLNVALGLRVNQYKLLVYLSLTLNFLNFFLNISSINNRMFRRNNRLFFCCFVVLLLLFLANLIFVLDSHRILLNIEKFSKTSITQFTPSRLRPYILT